jgi:hypothetical protein
METASIEFTVNDFNYTVKFYEDNLYIVVEHKKEFHKWTHMFSADCGEVTSGMLTFKFYSKFIYDLLYDYAANKLDESVEIVFPNKIKDPWAALPITINMCMNKTIKISKLLTLEYVKTDDQDRLQKMVLQQRDQIADLTEQISRLNKVFTIDVKDPTDDDLTFYFQDPTGTKRHKIEKDATLESVIDAYKIYEKSNYTSLTIYAAYSIDISHLKLKNSPILLHIGFAPSYIYNNTTINHNNCIINIDNTAIMINSTFAGYMLCISFNDITQYISGKNEEYKLRYSNAINTLNTFLKNNSNTEILTGKKDKFKLVLISTD